MIRPAIINRLFLIAAFAAPACAVFDHTWYRAAPSLTPVWVRVSVPELSAICHERETGRAFFACVVRDLPHGLCFVFSPVAREVADPELIYHEEQKHCREGLNHE